MYIVKNALKNLSRNKGRNILVGILLFIMLTVLCVSIVINSASAKMADVYNDQFNINAVLKVDYQSLISTSVNGVLDIPPLTSADYKNFADSDYVTDCYTFGSLGVYVPDILAIGEDNKTGTNGGTSMILGDGGYSDYYFPANLSLYGYSDLSQLTDFIEGNRAVIDGSAFSNLNDCIVSEQLAEKNKLKVGDMIEVNTGERDENKKESLSLKISGIYSSAIPEDTSFVFSTTQLRNNDIIVSFDTISQLNSDKYGVEGSFVLSGLTAVSNFENELSKKGLPKAYYLSTNSAEYEKVTAPAEGMSHIVRIFMIIVLIFGSGILIFLSFLNVRERKYEIGILRAKGMSKGKIAIQFFVENLTLIVLCLVLALSTGLLTAQPVSDMLLRGEIEKIEEGEKAQSNQMNNIFSMNLTEDVNFGANTENIELPKSVDVDFNLTNILIIVLLSIILCVITSLSGVIYLTKNEPMRILVERN